MRINKDLTKLALAYTKMPLLVKNLTDFKVKLFKYVTSSFKQRHYT